MKKKIIFKGAATALITPIKNGNIDYPSLGRIIELQIQSGISALVIGGTTGEAATLTDTERERLYSYAAEAVGDRVPLIFGVGTNDTALSLRHTALAERIGCEGILVVTPYYNKGTERGVTNHYLKIAESSYLPTILYNVPSRTGVNLRIEQIAKLAEHPNIVAIKEATDSVERLVSLSALGEELTLYAGNDSQIYPVLALGGAGVISVISNALPRATAHICESFFSGSAEDSRAEALRLLPFMRSLFAETNPAPIKHVMMKRGLCTSELRLPMDEVLSSTAVMLDGQMESLRALFDAELK